MSKRRLNNGHHAKSHGRDARKPGSVIAALDIGSSKVAAFIVRAEDEDGFTVLGFSHQLAQGIRGGTITDLSAAGAIGHCIHNAEKMAGLQVDDVIVNVAGSHMAAHSATGGAALNGLAIDEGDIGRALTEARALPEPETRAIVQGIPIRYRVDGDSGVDNPRGLCGRLLEADVTIVTGCANRLRNLDRCIGENHLAIGARCASGYAAGLATLHADESELGCLLLDIGGGTTDIAVFRDGAPVYLDSLPLGGQHLTNDLARGLTTTVSCAERLKTMYGSLIHHSGGRGDIVEVPQVGEDDPGCANQVATSTMTSILRPRMEEILELVRSRLTDAGVDRAAGRRAVLTGGASQIGGMREFAQQALGKQVRLGRPLARFGLADANGGPAFATGVGLILYALRNLDHAAEPTALAPPSSPWFGRVGQWLRLNL